MALSILLAALSCAAMVLGILFLPKVRLGPVAVDSFWAAPFLGALLALALGVVDLPLLGHALADFSQPINPLKILVLFLSMAILSIFLDEASFFRYLASATLRRAKTSQARLFLLLYLMVSVLTVFTSNDIVVLSFTPFICHFARNARINPLPYLAAEFVAANTWSMALVIGNPTNIYLATTSGIGFAPYARTMLLPTLGAGTAAFLLLRLLFRKSLSAPLGGEPETIRIQSRTDLCVGLGFLGTCTVALAIAPLLGFEMWTVSAVAVAGLFATALLLAICRRRAPRALLACLRRAPWTLVPFVLSMFVLITGLNQHGATAALGGVLSRLSPIPAYGVSSFLASNLVNNIPMSVLFSSVLGGDASTPLGAVYATIVGSNLGALFTPVGALAGILWVSILRHYGLRFGYRDFLRLGIAVALPALAVALALLR